MANIINGTDTGSGGLITTGDSSDELQLQTAETARVTLTNTAVVVNEGGNDVDFRVEGDTNANLLFVDASADAVGIGTNSPSGFGSDTVLAVYDATTPRIKLQNSTTGSANTDGAELNMSSSDFIIENREAGNIRLFNNGSERLRIDSAGNMGLGVTPSDWGTYRTLQVGLGAAVSSAANASIVISSNAYNTNNAGVWKYISSNPASNYEQYIGGHYWSTAASGTAGNNITFTTAMTLDASGRLLVGTTSNSFTNTKGLIAGSETSGGQAVYGIYNSEGTSASDGSPALGIYKQATTTTSAARFVQFYANGVSSPMGGIVGNGATNVQFASISDVREKTNITPINGSLEKIIALNPVEFDWIANGEHCPAGFVAQDVEQVFPEFVIENFAQEGQEPRKGLTGGMTGGIVAHLVKAIQELKAELDTVKAELATLKG